MTGTPQKTARQVSIEKGKQTIVAIIICFIMLELLTLVLKIIYGQGIAFSSIIRWILTIILCVYLYRGKDWAKMLITFGTSLGIFIGIYSIFLVLRSPAPSIFGLLLIVAATVFNTATAYFLIFSSDVDEFMKSLKT